MVLDLQSQAPEQDPRRWQCRSDDHSEFAYARGHNYIRRSDHTLWAHLSEECCSQPDRVNRSLTNSAARSTTTKPVSRSTTSRPNTFSPVPPRTGENVRCGQRTTRARAAPRPSRYPPKHGAVMTVSVSAATSTPTRELASDPARSHVASALLLFALIALTGLVAGLIVAVTFAGVLDQLTTASH
jgi:hypothetical protein